ncbi:MAG TPA: hypothetical protein VKO20_09650 [Desulfosalsimonadaceae bacterium]|nr:hypothetical protein [Desulfosalsimonadaceae bacterium]
MAGPSFSKPFWIRAAAPIAAAMLLVCTSVSIAAAADKRVSVIGSSQIYNDVSNARDAALAEGLLSAVETVALELIPQQNLKADFATISRALYENRKDITRNYQVLKEVHTGDYYCLLIRATVSEDRIRALLEDMQVSITPEGLPRVLLLIAEKRAGRTSYDSRSDSWEHPPDAPAARNTTEQAIRNVLKKQGYPLVSASKLDRDEFRRAADAGAALQTKEARRLGKLADAEVVVFGTSQAGETQNRLRGEAKTFQASVALTATGVETQKTLVSVEELGKSTGRDIAEGSRTALTEAGTRAGSILAERIAPAWRELLRQRDALEIHVKGKKNFLKHLVRLRQAIRGIEGVSDLQMRRRSRNQALMSLRYEGSSRGLADKIVLSTFEDFGINIYEVNEDRLRIELLTTNRSITETDLQ